MKHIFIIYIICISLNAYSKTIDVKLINRIYMTTINQNTISLVAHDMDLSLVKSNCNSRIFDQTVGYINSLERHLEDQKLSEMKMKSFIEIDSRKLFIDPQTKLADAFRGLPQTMIEAKFKEKLVCK